MEFDMNDDTRKNTTLLDDLAKSRTAIETAPVTMKDCHRILATLKDHSCLVDRATIIRCFEFLLGRNP